MSSSNEPITADQDKNCLLSGLPPAETRRWSSRRKAAIVIAIRAGVLNRQEAYERYTLLSKSSPLGRPRSIKTASGVSASPACKCTAAHRLESPEGSEFQASAEDLST